MLEPLSDSFMQRAIAEVILIGLAGGALGCWVALYEVSYAAESLAHSLLPGLVIAAIAGVPALLGATPALVLGALAIALVSRTAGLSRDSAIAVVVTTLFGLGALLALSPESPPGIEALLFGDVLGTGAADLVAAGVLAVAVPLVLWLLHGRLLANGFDSASAPALGFSAARVDFALLLLVAAAIAVAVGALGNLLVVALLVGPGAAARHLTDRVVPMMLVASGIAAVTGIAGLYVSYYAGTAAGASIALAVVAAYLLAAAAGELRCLRGRRALRAEATIA